MTRRGDTLELAVLGLLHDSPVHGYELRKQLTVVLGWGRVLSYGSLYPALKKMLRAGWISEEPVMVGRRQRITYALTPAGDRRFTALMADAGPAAWEDDSFELRFAFFGRTDADVRLRILEGRRTRLEERLDRIRSGLELTKGWPRRDRYAAELHRHGIESVEREVRWLTDLIAAERREVPPGGPAPQT